MFPRSFSCCKTLPPASSLLWIRPIPVLPRPHPWLEYPWSCLASPWGGIPAGSPLSLQFSPACLGLHSKLFVT